MLGKNIEMSPLEALFLLVLHGTPSLSGSRIVKKLKSDLGEEWSPSPGATYKIIQSLQEKGFIQETTADENQKDQRIRTYSLTNKGEEMVPEVSERVRKLVLFLNSCCPDFCGDIVIVKREEGC